MTLDRRTPLKRQSRPTAVFRCATCSSLFKRRADHKPRNAEGLLLCTPCSRSQRNKGRTYPQRRNGRAFSCIQCGTEFYRNLSDAALRRTKFCTRACRTTWQRTQEPPHQLIGAADNSGERNGQYRDGKRVGEHVNKPKVRAQVIERDGDWCLICGRPPQGLHLHRVRYGSEGGKYEVTNCVQLCGDHHSVVHSDKKLWKPRLLAHIADPGSSEFGPRS